MISRLLDMLTGAAAPSPADRGRHDAHDLHLAAAALLIEMATVDRTFDPGERQRILRYARDRLGLAEAEAGGLMAAAEREAADSVQLHRFTQIVKGGFSYEERVQLMETLWEVAYTDGDADPHENQLMRRIAGLIYVTDRDSGLARRRAIERIDREGQVSRSARRPT